MAAAFDRRPGTEVRDRARTLRTYALELAERDQDAYAGVLEALKLPESAPERPGRVQAALSAAADGPLALARAAGEVAGLAAQLALTGNPHLVGDATAAALLAEAATRAATRLVELNLSGLPGDPRLQVARELAELAADARARALEGRGSAGPSA